MPESHCLRLNLKSGQLSDVMVIKQLDSETLGYTQNFPGQSPQYLKARLGRVEEPPPIRSQCLASFTNKFEQGMGRCCKSD